MTDFNTIFQTHKENPEIFKVPEGYFDSLAGNIMKEIPEENKVIVMKPNRLLSRRWETSKRWVAACIIILCITGISSLYTTSWTNDISANQDIHDDLMEETDYAMIDTRDLYYYVTEEDAL